MSVTNENDSGDSRKMVGGLCPGVNNSVYQIYIYMYYKSMIMMKMVITKDNDHGDNGNS